jgi:hypothetical protein
VHPEYPESQRVLRVEFAPDIVWQFLEGLERVIVLLREAAVDQPLRGGTASTRSKPGSAGWRSFAASAARALAAEVNRSRIRFARPCLHRRMDDLTYWTEKPRQAEQALNRCQHPHCRGRSG